MIVIEWFIAGSVGEARTVAFPTLSGGPMFAKRQA